MVRSHVGSATPPSVMVLFISDDLVLFLILHIPRASCISDDGSFQQYDFNHSHDYH